jgi:hypothetical protein
MVAGFVERDPILADAGIEYTVARARARKAAACQTRDGRVRFAASMVGQSARG